MKKITKILSVILCVLTVLLSANIFSFAADAAAVSESYVSEEESTENPSAEDSEKTDGEEQTGVDDDTETEDVQDSGEKKITYFDAVGGSFALGLYLCGGIVSLPVGAAALSVAFLPMIFFLPVTLPVAAVGGAGASALGVVIMALSPLIGLVECIAQMF